MTTYELQQEIGSLQEKARKAEQLGMVNEYAVLERKVTMARSYLLDPEAFKAGKYMKFKEIRVHILKLII